jgi:hypothetical protein
VVQGLVAAVAERKMTLYTRQRIRGGLLGHWSIWTKRAVELLDRMQEAVASREITNGLLKVDSKI